MKYVYRIVTPLLAVGAIVMGVVLKLFQFEIGGASEQVDQLVQLAKLFNVDLAPEYSIYEIISLVLNSNPAENEVDLVKIAEPIMPQLISFVVFFVLSILIFLALGIVAAATNKRKAVIGMSVAGIISLFVCIIISNNAFDILIAGEEIALNDVVQAFSDNPLISLAVAFVKINTARLSAGFYAVFGMYMLVIFWTILCNMLIKTPIQVAKKHRRKKPMKKLSAVFGK